MKQSSKAPSRAGECIPAPAGELQSSAEASYGSRIPLTSAAPRSRCVIPQQIPHEARAPPRQSEPRPWRVWLIQGGRPAQTSARRSCVKCSSAGKMSPPDWIRSHAIPSRRDSQILDVLNELLHQYL